MPKQEGIGLLLVCRRYAPNFVGANGRTKDVAVVSGEVIAVRRSALMLCPAQRKDSDRRKLFSGP
jgi:hypothetical protein